MWIILMVLYTPCSVAIFLLDLPLDLYISGASRCGAVESL